MRLFLSSQDFGKHRNKLLELVGAGRNAVLIANASDYKPTQRERDERVSAEYYALESLGFSAKELDLRNADELKIDEILDWADLIWVRGGNSIDLASKMQSSGFAKKIKEALNNDSVVYAGYSAGACVVCASLEGVEYADANFSQLSSKELRNIALNLYPNLVIPHYNPVKTKEIKNWEQYCIKNDIDYIGLADGEVIIVNGEHEEILR